MNLMNSFIERLHNFNKVDPYLVQQDQKFIRIINSLPHLVTLKDGHGRWILANNTALNLLGLVDIVYAGKTDIELAGFSSKYKEIFLNRSLPDENVWLERNVVETLEKISDLNGDIQSFNISKMPYFDAMTSPKMLVTIGRDVTHQTHAKNSLEIDMTHYVSLYKNNPNGIAAFDLMGNIIRVNHEFEEILGYSSEELLQMSFLPHIAYSDLERTIDNFTKSANGESHRYKINALHKNGYTIVLDLSCFPIIVNDEIVGVYTIIRDITEQEKLRKQQQASAEYFRKLVQNSSDVIAVVDEKGNVKYDSPSVIKLLGFKAEDRMGKNMFSLIHEDDYVRARSRFDFFQGKNGETGIIELRVRDAKENILWLSITASNHIHDPDVNGFILNIRDVTHKKEYSDVIENMAYKDDLTNLPNRRAFEEHLSTSIQQGNVQEDLLAVLFLDLDHFKFVNDTLGHGIGDKLLNLVAIRVGECLKESDYFSRRSGDEFTILLHNRNTKEDVIRTANRILKSFEKPFLVDGYELYVTCSIGITLFPEDGQDMETLLKCADTALYQAKEGGKNRYRIFSSSMNIRTYKTFVIQRDLRKALEENNELEMHYQPRIDPISSRIKSAEALIRWNHHEWGMIRPDEFIPIAEQSGLIVQIGEWVLETVCQHLKEWKEVGIVPVPISINISAIQFMQKNFADLILKTLEKYEIEGEFLEIEVTENTILKNEEVVSQTIQKLKNRGVKVAVDDFGTGHSSLKYLQRFAFDCIKIDRSFISNLHKVQDDEIIVKTIIQLAHALDMYVVAEGVENKEQLALLLDHQCDEIQGYIYSKPISIKEFIPMLKRGTCDFSLAQQDVPNRRKYYRIDLHYPIGADMTILNIGNRKVNIGNTEVLITDIGPGGLRFRSNINLPVNPEIVLQFSTEIYEPIKLSGHIVWSSEPQEDVFEYGLRYVIAEQEQTRLTGLLNQLLVRLRQNPIEPNCRFVTEGVSQFFTE